LFANWPDVVLCIGAKDLVAFKYLNVWLQDLAIEVDESFIVRLVRMVDRQPWLRLAYHF